MLVLVALSHTNSLLKTRKCLQVLHKKNQIRHLERSREDLIPKKIVYPFLKFQILFSSWIIMIFLIQCTCVEMIRELMYYSRSEIHYLNIKFEL